MSNDSIGFKITNFKKIFGSIVALNNISIRLEPGLLHGLIGPEGSGKTTLMRSLIGLLHATSGNIEYFKDDILINLNEIRESIAYMPQTQSLYRDLSVSEHLEFFRALYRIPRKFYEEKREELLHITRLEKFIDRPAGQLSGGMYKKLGLMCSLLRNPSVLLLDEPTNGVDPISRREFWELLYQLLDKNVTILVATAYMDEAERCTKVHILESGIHIDSGEPKEILLKHQAKSFDQLFINRMTSKEDHYEIS